MPRRRPQRQLAACHRQVAGPRPQRSLSRRANHRPRRHPLLPQGATGVVQGSQPQGARGKGATDRALGQTMGSPIFRTAPDRAYLCASASDAIAAAHWQTMALRTRPTARRCAKRRPCRFRFRHLLRHLESQCQHHWGRLPLLYRRLLRLHRGPPLRRPSGLLPLLLLPLPPTPLRVRHHQLRR
jgi:hypothetical protein